MFEQENEKILNIIDFIAFMQGKQNNIMAHSIDFHLLRVVLCWDHTVYHFATQ